MNKLMLCDRCGKTLSRTNKARHERVCKRLQVSRAAFDGSVAHRRAQRATGYTWARSEEVSKRIRHQPSATGNEIIQCAFCPYRATAARLYAHARAIHRDRYEIGALGWVP